MKQKSALKQENLISMIPHFPEIFKSRFRQGFRESEPVLKGMNPTIIAISSENDKKRRSGEQKFYQ